MKNTDKMPLPRYIAFVYRNGRLVSALKVISSALVLLTVLAFSGEVVYLAFTSVMEAVMFAVFCAVPFLAVSCLRVWIDAKRPYEIYNFEDIKIPSQKNGRSMPSRHTLSAFVIGTLLCFIHLPLGLFLITVGIAIAVLRVILGIHFVRDVLVGAAIGIASGVFGGLIINFYLH